MARRKLSPGEIVERLHLIDALHAEGQPIADAIQSAGMLQVEYDQWRTEYAGLLRTLGPLSSRPPKSAQRARLGGPVRAPK